MSFESDVTKKLIGLERDVARLSRWQQNDPEASVTPEPHNIVGAEHTVIGSALQLVGLSGTNTLGLLTASASPGAAEAILKSSASGGLTLPLLAGSTSVTTPLVTNSSNVTISSINSNVAITANGDITLGANDDVSISASDDISITATDNLTLSADDIYLDNDMALQTTGAATGFGGVGWQINWPVSGKAHLDIRSIYAEELEVTVFTADMLRIRAGETFLGQSIGIVGQTFTTPANGANVTVVFEDNANFTGALFTTAVAYTAGDWILIQYIEHGTGLTIQKVWFRAYNYVDLSGAQEGYQQWTLRKVSGPTGLEIKKGAIAIDWGQSGDGVIHESVIPSSQGPWTRYMTWVTDPSVPANYTYHTWVGRLDAIVDADLDPSGYGLYGDNVFLKGKMVFSAPTATYPIIIKNAGNPQASLSILGIDYLGTNSYDIINNNNNVGGGEIRMRLSARDNGIAYAHFYNSANLSSSYKDTFHLIFGHDIGLSGAGGDSGQGMALQVYDYSASAFKTYWKSYETFAGSIYFDVYGPLTVGGTIYRGGVGTIDIGTLGSPFNNLYVDNIVASTITGSTALGGQTWQYDSGDMYVRSNAAATRTLFLANSNASYAMGLDVEGNIAVGGTVDGIDIAAHASNANAHHNQSHLLANTTSLGPDHTVSGLTAGYYLRASGATTAAFAAILDADIPSTIVRTSRILTAGDGLVGGGNLSADRVFDIGEGDGIDVSANAIAVDVTDIIDTAYGLTENTNNIRINLSGSTLEFNAGALRVNEDASFSWLGRHTFGTYRAQFTGTTAPTSGVGIEVGVLAGPVGRMLAYDRGGSVYIPMDISGSEIRLEVSGTDRVTVGATTVAVDADLQFTGAQSITTSSGALTLSPTANLVLDPGSLVEFPDAQEARTTSFSDLVTGIAGFRMWDAGSNTRWLVGYGAKFDELHARVFVADETRVDRGAEYWSKSYGIVETSFVTPADEATVSVWFEDAAGIGSAALFSVNDWLMLRSIDWSTGLTIFLQWYQVVSGPTDGTAADGTTRQRWVIRRKAGGSTGVTVKKGSLLVDVGQAGQGWVHLSALTGDGGPFVQVGTWSSDPSVPGNFKPLARMGHLSGFGGLGTGIYGFAAAKDGSIAVGSGYEGFAIDATNGANFYNTAFKVWNSTLQTVDITSSGNVKLGIDVSAAATTGLTFTASSGDLLLGNSAAANVLWDHSDGILYFRNGSTAQAYVNTNGQIYAGAGAVRLNSGGMDIYNGTAQTGDISTTGNVRLGTNVSADATTTFYFVGSTGQLRIGPPTAGNLLWDVASGQLRFREGTSNIRAYVDTDGRFYAGTGAVRLGESGIDLYDVSAGTHTGVIDVDGDVKFGSNVDAVATTQFALFTVSQSFNSETMGAGDLLVGNHAAGHMMWDNSTGRLNFRNTASTTHAYVGSDGKFYAGSGTVVVDSSGLAITKNATAEGINGSISWYENASTRTTRLSMIGTAEYTPLGGYPASNSIGIKSFSSGTNAGMVTLTAKKYGAGYDAIVEVLAGDSSGSGAIFSIIDVNRVTGTFIDRFHVYESYKIGGYWTATTLAANWANYNASTHYGLEYKTLGDLVFVRGTVYRTSGSSVPVTIATGLPAPNKTVARGVRCTGGAMAYVSISTSGVLSLDSGNASSVLNLDDIVLYSISAVEA